MNHNTMTIVRATVFGIGALFVFGGQNAPSQEKVAPSTAQVHVVIADEALPKGATTMGRLTDKNILTLVQ